MPIRLVDIAGKAVVVGIAPAVRPLNAGAALYVAGISDTLEEGMEAAVAAIDDGNALDALEGLRKASSTSG